MKTKSSHDHNLVCCDHFVVLVILWLISVAFAKDVSFYFSSLKYYRQSIYLIIMYCFHVNSGCSFGKVWTNLGLWLMSSSLLWWPSSMTFPLWPSFPDKFCFPFILFLCFMNDWMLLFFILFEYRVLICLISLLSSVLISYMNDWMNIHDKILATLLGFLIGFPVKGANNVKKPTTKRLFSKCA